MNPVDRVLGALDRVKSAGHGKWKARCPAHDDRNPSLSVAEGDNGSVLVHCFAGCDAAAVVQAMGLQLSDLYPKDTHKHSRGNAPDPFRPKPRPRQVDTEEPAPRPFKLARIGEIELKPTDWLIRDFLVRDTLAGLIAPPGACKSFLAIDWACRVATGTHWNEHEVKPGVVFYLAGEGQAGIRKRVSGWEKHNAVNMAKAPMFVSSSMPFLCDYGNVEITAEILEEAAESIFFDTGQEPELIVVDTVARAMNGADENTAKDMGAFIRACDTLRERWGCTVLTVHHTGHDPTAAKRGRGSSNYGANLDSDFYLTAKGDMVLLEGGTKSKDWATPPPTTLQRLVVPIEVPGEDSEPVAESTLVLINSAGQILEKGKRERAMELREQGMTEREIAEAVGVGKSTVNRWLKDHKQDA